MLALVSVKTKTCSSRLASHASATSSSAFFPCGIAGASVPTAIRTPASAAARADDRARGNISAAFERSSGAAEDTSILSASAVVGTRNVPRLTISAIVSSSMRKPCSMQSTPASTAARTASAPCVCAATRRPRRCASSTIARSSSSE